VEDRVSGLKDKTGIKEKNRRLLRQKTQEMWKEYAKQCNSINRPNLQIKGIEEGEYVQGKGINNIFNKIITENFSNLRKEMPIQVQEASRTPNRHDQNRTSLWHITLKTTSTENKERILKAVREKSNNI
jgi:hypothetical protein